MSDTQIPPVAPRFDLNILLKYVSGGVLMGMLFTLVLLGKVAPDTFETLAVGALGAIGGHAAGALVSSGTSREYALPPERDAAIAMSSAGHVRP